MRGPTWNEKSGNEQREGVQGTHTSCMYPSVVSPKTRSSRSNTWTATQPQAIRLDQLKTASGMMEIVSLHVCMSSFDSIIMETWCLLGSPLVSYDTTDMDRHSLLSCDKIVVPRSANQKESRCIIPTTSWAKAAGFRYGTASCLQQMHSILSQGLVRSEFELSSHEDWTMHAAAQMVVVVVGLP